MYPVTADVFRDRRDAGRQVADLVAGNAAEVVLGLPRGGVVVAAVVAERLHADLDVVLVRKLGAPHHREWGVGALAEDEPPQWDRAALAYLGAGPEDLADIVAEEAAEIRRRAAVYRPTGRAPAIAGRRVLVVDDGLATGVTARAALRWVQGRGPRASGFAVPVSLSDPDRILAGLTDRVWAVRVAAHLGAVGAAYRDFREVTDDEVTALLRAHRRARAGTRPGFRETGHDVPPPV